MFEVDAVEARGDAAEALRLIDDMPLGPDGRPWWRPSRIRRLRQIADLEESAPAWAKVMDHDWVYRQLVLHENGGLAAFLRTRAGSSLLKRALGVERWVSAPMGGFELLLEGVDRILWLDLANREVVETINVGAAAMLADGECVIGRLVESDGVALFESAPLCVPPDIAKRVAGDPGNWVAAVADGCRDSGGPILSQLVARFHDFDLLCDLPTRVRRRLVQPLDPDLSSDQIGTGGNGHEYDAVLVLAALAGEIDVEGEGDGDCTCERCHDVARPVAALVAAAVLEPGTTEALLPLLVQSDVRELKYLARLLPAPADEVCRRLARRLSEAA